MPLHESEDRFVFGIPVSCANHAAAFPKISRSIRRRLISRRRSVSSLRSSVVNPPSPCPWSQSACFTHRLIAHWETPNSRANSGSHRPARCSSTSCRRDSGAYRFARFGNFDLTMADTSNTNCRVCTKAGEDHYTEGFSRFVTFATAPIATGWSDSCRVRFAPTERPCLCTANGIIRAKLAEPFTRPGSASKNQTRPKMGDTRSVLLRAIAPAGLLRATITTRASIVESHRG